MYTWKINKKKEVITMLYFRSLETIEGLANLLTTLREVAKEGYNPLMFEECNKGSHNTDEDKDERLYFYQKRNGTVVEL